MCVQDVFCFFFAQALHYQNKVMVSKGVSVILWCLICPNCFPQLFITSMWCFLIASGCNCTTSETCVDGSITYTCKCPCSWNCEEIGKKWKFHTPLIIILHLLNINLLNVIHLNSELDSTIWMDRTHSCPVLQLWHNKWIESDDRNGTM